MTRIAKTAAWCAGIAWIGWLAWALIQKRAVGDLLILAGILVAFPAWHAVTKALDREMQRDIRMSQQWMKERGEP